MCAPKSFLVFPGNRIHFPLDMDSHSEMLEAKGIKDDKPFPTFVKLEIYPDDKDLFNHDPGAWKLHIDQDRVPEWFDFDGVQNEVRNNYLPEWWRERFIINREVYEIRNGIWYMGHGGTLQDMWGGTLQDMWGGTLQTMWGGTLQDMWGGTLQDMRGGIVVSDKNNNILLPTGSKKQLVYFERNSE